MQSLICLIDMDEKTLLTLISDYTILKWLEELHEKKNTLY